MRLDLTTNILPHLRITLCLLLATGCLSPLKPESDSDVQPDAQVAGLVDSEAEPVDVAADAGKAGQVADAADPIIVHVNDAFTPQTDAWWWPNDVTETVDIDLADACTPATDVPQPWKKLTLASFNYIPWVSSECLNQNPGLDLAIPGKMSCLNNNMVAEVTPDGVWTWMAGCDGGGGVHPGHGPAEGNPKKFAPPWWGVPGGLYTLPKTTGNYASADLWCINHIVSSQAFQKYLSCQIPICSGSLATTNEGPRGNDIRTFYMALELADGRLLYVIVPPHEEIIGEIFHIDAGWLWGDTLEACKTYSKTRHDKYGYAYLMNYQLLQCLHWNEMGQCEVP